MNLKYLILTASTLCAFACSKKDDTDSEKGAKAEPAQKSQGAAKAIAKKATLPASPAMKMASLDLVYEDFKATISAPEGATFKESYGTLEVKLGDGKDFFLQIDTDAPDMAAVKASVEKNNVQKLVKIHTESADTFIYETEAFGKTSFWLNSAVKVGESTVHCYSGRGANSYTQAHIAVFEKACKTLAPKP